MIDQPRRDRSARIVFPIAALFVAAGAFFIASGCRPSVAPENDLVPKEENLAMEDVDADPVGAVSVQSDPPTIAPADSASQSIRMLAWNIESNGANGDVIADQLSTLGRYDIYGFTEVRPLDWPAIKASLGDGFVYFYSKTGYDDRTAFAINKFRFDVLDQYEMEQHEGYVLNPGNYRSPHVCELKDRATGTQFLLMLNHLARGKAAVRQRQAEGLREWAKTIEQPIVAIGDYNFDYVFATQKGNPAFDLFLADDVYQWVVPEPLIDSNWYDGDQDGEDDYPGSILDFAFVTGQAKSWRPVSRVIVREGDFPDDLITSDHRPIELVLTP